MVAFDCIPRVASPRPTSSIARNTKDALNVIATTAARFGYILIGWTDARKSCQPMDEDTRNPQLENSKSESMSEVFVPKDRLLLVSINKSIEHLPVYDATRYAWRVDRTKVESVDLVLGCENQVVKGVFVVSRWLDASPGEPTERNFPGFTATHKGQRWGFEGKEANETDQRNYLEKRLPDTLRIGRYGLRYFGV
jgi:hypothetical protein